MARSQTESETQKMKKKAAKRKMSMEDARKARALRTEVPALHKTKKKPLLHAPFQYFGGKSRVACQVWDLMGRDIKFYVEPFFGSGAVLLAEPASLSRYETVNDLDGFITNAWRAIQKSPDKVFAAFRALHSESEYKARVNYCKKNMPNLVQKIQNSTDYFNSKLAGYWIYSVCLSIGGPRYGGFQRSDISTAGRIHKQTNEFFRQLSKRFERVCITCRDWEKMFTKKGILPNETDKKRKPVSVGIFLDPPYKTPERDQTLYNHEEADNNISSEIQYWCAYQGKKLNYRIVLCGYENEHGPLESLGWKCYYWKAHSGFAARAGQKLNAYRERIWASPGCQEVEK